MTTRLLPLGTRVAVLEDTFGDLAVTGTIAGYVAYTRPHDTVTDQGYALHLDQGFLADLPDIPAGCRPWIGTIVVHVESVTATCTIDQPCDTCVAEGLTS